MADGKSINLLDVWREAAPFFSGYSEEAPEIVLHSMKDSTMSMCLMHLMLSAREITTEFTMQHTQIKVLTPSPGMTVRALSAGHISGGIWLEIPALPTLGIFVDMPGAISISFVRGEWDAMSLAALFVLLRDLCLIAPESNIALEGMSYEAEERADFVSVVQAYLNESA